MKFIFITLFYLALKQTSQVEAQAAVNVAANNALYSAAQAGNLIGVQKAINNGANVNTPYVNTVGKYKVSPLIIAIGSNQTAVVKEIINAGANLNSQNSNGDTPVAIAIGRPIEIISALISAGANVSIPSKGGVTPLMIACNIGSLDTVKLLINANASIYALDSLGHSAIAYTLDKNILSYFQVVFVANVYLLQAARSGNLAGVQDAVLYQGANVDSQTFDGLAQTALMLAANNPPIVQFLKDRGANLNLRDYYSKTVLHYATLYRNVRVIEILTKNPLTQKRTK